MSSPQVEACVIDEENEIKIGLHGLRVRQIIQVLENRHIIVPNRNLRRGLYLVIGKDKGGAFISIPVEGTTDSIVWRPITAWKSKKSEKALWEKGRRRNE
jgi:hypothetical protein